MDSSKYLFQYCQKLVMFSDDWKSVLLAKRHGEQDYDGTYSFICGKMEITDKSIIEGLKREKDEEIGKSARVIVYPKATNNLLFQKKDGSMMVLPHYLGQFIGGKIDLNKDEYSEYKWVKLENLRDLEPKVENIPETVSWALSLSQHVSRTDFVEI